MSLWSLRNAAKWREWGRVDLQGFCAGVLRNYSRSTADIALGHADGGELVRRLYGHRDYVRALDRVTAAYERTASFTQARLW